MQNTAHTPPCPQDHHGLSAPPLQTAGTHLHTMISTLVPHRRVPKAMFSGFNNPPPFMSNNDLCHCLLLSTPGDPPCYRSIAGTRRCSQGGEVTPQVRFLHTSREFCFPEGSCSDAKCHTNIPFSPLWPRNFNTLGI